MIPTCRSLMALLVLCGMSVCTASSRTKPLLVLQTTRHSATDLEIGGSLVGVPQGQTRFVSYAALLSLPQETYTVTGDSNFGAPVQISGVSLKALPVWLGAEPGASMVIAICDDQYAAHYPASYLSAHHPLLVLKVNGLDPAHWPLGTARLPMGPYMVSHPNFKPSFRVLAHEDEPQVPWGVVRIDLRREQSVYAPIEPHGAAAADPAVQQGYIIASQSCFRCHSNAGEGGQKSRLLWGDLANEAVSNPAQFDAYVLQPKKFTPHSQMASSLEYDPATLRALRRYFATFQESTR